MSNRTQVKCPVCKNWIDCSPGAEKVPDHKFLTYPNNPCPGSYKTAIDKRS